jgi:hypothetical protein
MGSAIRPGMYNITEHAIIAHANDKTVAKSDGVKPKTRKRVPARDMLKHRRARTDMIDALFGPFDEGASPLEKSKGIAVPYSTNVIEPYVPPRACERLKDSDGKVLLKRSEKTVALALRLVSAYTAEHEQVLIPCGGAMNDAIAALSINR